MRHVLTISIVALMTASASAVAQAPDRLERRVQQLEQKIARLEKRVADLEAKPASGERRGMMGGGKPNEQWRSPDAGR